MVDFVRWVKMNWEVLKDLDDDEICNLYFGYDVVKRSEAIDLILGNFGEEIGTELCLREERLECVKYDGLRDGLRWE